MNNKFDFYRVSVLLLNIRKMQTIYGKVITANILLDGNYELHIESLDSDIEYRNCSVLIQPGINTFPKVDSIVLMHILFNGEYIVIGEVADKIKKGILIEHIEHVHINSPDIKLLGDTITANGEDLTIDIVGS